MPDGTIRIKTIFSEFEKRYKKEMTPSDFEINNSGNIRWCHSLQGEITQCRNKGFLTSPALGFWQITEEGRQWLDKNIHVTDESSARLVSRGKRLSMQERPQPTTITRSESIGKFLDGLQVVLSHSVQSALGTISYKFVQRSNYLQIRLVGFQGCHYEIILRPARHEIGLHFESSAERSQARLNCFEPHIDMLALSLNMPVYSGELQRRGWTQVRIENVAQPLTDSLAKKYADLTLQFITASLPVLKDIYAGEKPARIAVNKRMTISDNTIHAALDQEVATIRAYLEGRSALHVSDERLCDWINFCYLLGMYTEGKDLFALVNGAEVNPWYFNRTKKIARVCEQKSRLSATRSG